MKIGIVSASLLAERGWISLRAGDYLCPDDALTKDISRLEKAERTIKTTLANKRQELETRKADEDRLVAEGRLTLLATDR